MGRRGGYRDARGLEAEVPDQPREDERLQATGAWDAWDDVRLDAAADAQRRRAFAGADAEKSAGRVPDVRARGELCRQPARSIELRARRDELEPCRRDEARFEARSCVELVVPQGRAEQQPEAAEQVARSTQKYWPRVVPGAALPEPRDVGLRSLS